MNNLYLLLAFVTGAAMAAQSVTPLRVTGVALLLLGVTLIRWKTT